MNFKRITLVCIIASLILCGCSKANTEVSSETSVSISETTTISKEQEPEEKTPETVEVSETVEPEVTKEEAIMAILDCSPEETTESDESADKDIDYYIKAAQTLYELPYWKAFGLASLALNQTPDISSEEVVSFIEKGEHGGFESLFEGFFWDRYSDEETIEHAKAYAYYLTEYVLEAHSFTEFMSENYREEWLKARGCNSEYVYDSIDKLLDTAQSSYEDGRYLLRVGMDTWSCGNESWIQDASELYELIHTSEGYFSIVIQDLKDDAPTWYENLGKNKNDIVIDLYDNDLKSYTDTSNKGAVIHLGHALEAPHEYVHALTLGNNLTRFDGWMSEGLAVRYSLKFMADGLETFYYCYEVLQSEDIEDKLLNDGLGNDAVTYYNNLNEHYINMKEKYGDSYSDKLYTVMAVARQEFPDGHALDGLSLAEIGGGELGVHSYYLYIADHVSYFGAAAAVDILIKEFGADKVISFLYVCGDFKTDFGYTQQEFLEKIKEDESYKDAFIYAK